MNKFYSAAVNKASGFTVPAACYFVFADIALNIYSN